MLVFDRGNFVCAFSFLCYKLSSPFGPVDHIGGVLLLSGGTMPCPLVFLMTCIGMHVLTHIVSCE